MRQSAKAGVVLVVALSAALAVVHRGADAPPPAAPPPRVLRGMAELPERMERFLGGTLHLRLLDLRTADSGAVLLASGRQPVAPGATLAPWTLEIAAGLAPRADDAWLVVAVEDRRGLRFVGSGRPRDLYGTFRPRGAPAPAPVIGVRLAPVGREDSSGATFPLAVATPSP